MTWTSSPCHGRSARASRCVACGTGHPAVFLLFPVAKKDLGKAPALQMRENKHWVLNVTQDVTVDGKKKGTLGIGLTLIGFSSIA